MLLFEFSAHWRYLSYPALNRSKALLCQSLALIETKRIIWHRFLGKILTILIFLYLQKFTRKFHLKLLEVLSKKKKNNELVSDCHGICFEFSPITVIESIGNPYQIIHFYANLKLKILKKKRRSLGGKTNKNLFLPPFVFCPQVPAIFYNFHNKFESMKVLRMVLGNNLCEIQNKIHSDFKCFDLSCSSSLENWLFIEVSICVQYNTKQLIYLWPAVVAPVLKVKCFDLE